MTERFLPLCLFLAAGASVIVWTSMRSFAQSDAKPQQTGVAVVELFSSEGCSSCPPADEVLGEMVASARKSGAAVYPLAFHVDYWNGLGWTDRFSDQAYTRRQSDYANARKSDDIYTPQMIVNGTEQFVGSDRSAAKKAVATALAKPATATISLKIAKNNDGSYRANYNVTGAKARSVVNIALVERGLKSDVTRGENSGKTLHHENVVRWFRTRDLAASGTDQIDVALGQVNAKNASIVVYAQEPGNGAILGAAAMDLP